MIPYAYSCTKTFFDMITILRFILSDFIILSSTFKRKKEHTQQANAKSRLPTHFLGPAFLLPCFFTLNGSFILNSLFLLRSMEIFCVHYISNINLKLVNKHNFLYLNSKISFHLSNPWLV